MTEKVQNKNSGKGILEKRISKVVVLRLFQRIELEAQKLQRKRICF